MSMPGIAGRGGGRPPLAPRDAVEGKGPQRRPQERSDRRLEEVAKAVGGGYCRLLMSLKPALAVRETVAGRWQGAREVGTSPSKTSLGLCTGHGDVVRRPMASPRGSPVPCALCSAASSTSAAPGPSTGPGNGAADAAFEEFKGYWEMRRTRVRLSPIGISMRGAKVWSAMARAACRRPLKRSVVGTAQNAPPPASASPPPLALALMYPGGLSAKLPLACPEPRADTLPTAPALPHTTARTRARAHCRTQTLCARPPTHTGTTTASPAHLRCGGVRGGCPGPLRLRTRQRRTWDQCRAGTDAQACNPPPRLCEALSQPNLTTPPPPPALRQGVGGLWHLGADCAKSRLFSTTGSHGSPGPALCTPDAVLNGSCTLL